jgi:hypothetical protein
MSEGRSADAHGEVRVEPYSGPREDLRALFELAEDSPAELNSYLPTGQVLVALSGGEVIDHLQLVDTRRPGQVELKNMAVRDASGPRGRAAAPSDRGGPDRRVAGGVCRAASSSGCTRSAGRPARSPSQRTQSGSSATTPSATGSAIQCAHRETVLKGWRMTSEPHGGISDENRRIIGPMDAVRFSQSADLAHARHAFARPDVKWEDLTPDEQASATIAAYPWLLAARALYFCGCPRCGVAPSEITDLRDGRKKCPDCGHHFEFFED